MSSATPSTPGLGNTNSNPETKESTNKAPKNGSRAKTWFFTFNNYEPLHISALQNFFEKYNAEKYCFQEETGENGTPHLQGCVGFKNQIAFSTLKDLDKRIHWEKCKKFADAVVYCSKEATRTGKIYSKGIKITKPLKDPLKTPRKWQEFILELIKHEPDDRTIHWFYDPVGSTGKSALSKHILIKNQDKAIEVSGKSHDIKHGIVQFLENNNLEILLLDIPRTSEKYVSYEAIESVKNGKFFSGKYEGKMVLFDPPHIIIFSNFLPEIEKLSLDRWKIYEIKKNFDLEELNTQNLLNKDKIT